MFFANDQRDNVRSENPSVTFGRHPPCSPSTAVTDTLQGQVGKILGERWKALSAKQREPYEQKAKADKERYEREKASYNAGEDDEDDE